MSTAEDPVGSVKAEVDRVVRSGWRIDPENRYGLVILLIMLTYGVSASNAGPTASVAVLFVQLLAVWLVFTVAGSFRVRRVAGIVLVLIGVGAIAGGIFGAASDTPDISGLAYLANMVLYLVAPVVILTSLARRRTIDLQTFLGAIAAYLLIGMMFAFAYEAVAEIQGGPFFGAEGDGQLSDYLFFSFVTLTTTGYGNLVPATNPGQSMAVLEAITGQLFLVTAVAKIVTSWTPRNPT